jgi:serine phosphatase RsbU (regulator of sigma subunit)
MVAEPGLERSTSPGETRGGLAILEPLARASAAVAVANSLGDALQWLVDAVATALGADVVLVRVLEREHGGFVARAVSATPSLAAELTGTRIPADAIASATADANGAPEQLQRAAARVGATGVLFLPIVVGDHTAGTLELLRGRRFEGDERHAAALAASHVALALRAFEAKDGVGVSAPGSSPLELVGQALVAGADDHGGEDLAHLAAAVTGATGALVWERRGEDELVLAATHGEAGEVGNLRELADEACSSGMPVEEIRPDRLPKDVFRAIALPLGRPPLGVLQLLFDDAPADGVPELSALSRFGVRAAMALRAVARSEELEDELERTRALLAVIGQAIAELSLAHTLETAVDRVAALLGVDRLAVYLREDGPLHFAAGRGLAGPHVRVAERLLELLLGPLRGRGVVTFDRIAGQPLMAAVADAAGEAGIGAAIAVPLFAHDETIGLLAAYPRSRSRTTESEIQLFFALARQLAVAVQNARLHEQAKGLGEELEAALDAERQAARQLGALYEISRSFAQSLSLDATLQAVTRTVVEVLDIDAAVIAMPDERQERLVPRALHVAEPQLREAAIAVLDRPLPFGTRALQQLFRERVPIELRRASSEPVADVLRPFIARGWSGAVVPVATPAEVIASLSVFSFQPGSPITGETIAAAEAIGGQAALAIDNARLYQQQKQFADTMQRSLLPSSHPELPGLDIGHVYASAARMEVGGDVYDFVQLPDGRLAIVLGDVTGHGIEATADMAMAKFVFRSLAREHPAPDDFLAVANDVVVDEIAPGKFITMVYVTIDAKTGAIACAGAGHPPPRIVHADGRVEAIDAAGIVLGIDAGQEYEEVLTTLPRGGALVLYTDGVIEARRGSELYGFDRLDALLAASPKLPAAAIATSIVADCREFAGGELTDDCAAVVVKRL